MQGSIAQMAALAMHGNGFLQGSDIGTFWPASSTFKFCKQVTFVDLPSHGRVKETLYAPDPLKWFEKLRREGVVGLRLHHEARNDPGIRDRMSVAFVGGGGRWLLEAVKPTASDVWAARWQVGDKDDPERRIWSVAYGRTSANQCHILPKRAGDDRLCADLKDVLTQIARFAQEQQLDSFARCFTSGLEALSSEEPLRKVHHTDLAPNGALPLPSQRLLAAAQAAWVFGGMGSWNDLGFDGRIQERYDELSERLFTLINQAVVEATNASFTSRDGPRPSRPWWNFWSRD